MRKHYLLYGFLFFLLKTGSSQTIDPNFFGQNAWYTVYTDDGQPADSNDAFINYIAEVQASGATYCRIGGANANILGNCLPTCTNIPITREQILFLVKRIRLAGMEPVIQVPYRNLNNDNLQLAGDALNAADIVNYINITNLASIGGVPVENWIIANEPDKDMSGPDRIGYDYNEYQTTSPTEIAKYIKQFAIEMRKIDPLIKITGPELAFPWHHFFFSGTDTFFNANPFDGLLDGTTNDISGLIGTTDVFGNSTPVSIQGKPYIDHLSFHYYGSATSRSSVINNIHNTSDNYKVKQVLINLYAACISPAMMAKRGSSYPLTVAVTEANLSTTGTISDTDPDSYLRGQWWCDFMSVCLAQNVNFVNFWSSTETSLGFMQTGGTKRSAYHHFKLMADNFRETFLPNLNTASITNTKAFAYHDATAGKIGVLILNQNKTTPSSVNSLRINFDNSDPTLEDIKVKLDIIPVPTNPTYTCVIRTESTVLLIFDAATGNLLTRTEYNSEDTQNNVGPKTIINPPSSDLYVRDTPTDDGTEPNPGAPWNLVDGIDVWVRNAPATLVQPSPPRYTNEHLHENPEWTTQWQTMPSTQPLIYVKVRNRGCSAVSGTLRLYYHNSTLTDQWNNCIGLDCGSWTEILCGDTNGNGMIETGLGETACSNTITLAAGEEGVIEQVWNSVSDVMIFSDPLMPPYRTEWCLLARLEPIVGAEQLGISAGYNAQSFNDIVQKNVVFDNATAGLICHGLEFGNLSQTPSINRFDLIDMSSSFTPSNGFVSVDLGSALYDEWLSGGKNGSGITDGRRKYFHVSANGTSHIHDPLQPDLKPYVINVVSPDAYIGNITIPSSEIHPLCVMFNYFEGSGSIAPFEYSFRHYESVNNSSMNFSGAVKYYLNKPECPPIDAGANVTIGRMCNATLNATPIIPGATYTWRNNITGVAVGTGLTVQVSPFVTTTYELEVDFPNHCINYDLVTVTVSLSQAPCLPDCGTIDYNNQTINVNTVISGQIAVVSGTLRVTNNTTLTISNSELSFLPNAKIEVMPGGKLVIINSKLRACDIVNKWKGIFVKGINNVNDQLVITGSTISDAITPIVMDKVIGANITENIFAYGTVAITMDKSKDFTISKNEFYVFDVGVKATNGLLDTRSILSLNYFNAVKTAVLLEGGNHTKLDIQCNTFDSYTEYAIYSNNSTMKDQGSAGEGVGNVFISSSAQINDKFRHNGNVMKYFYNPSSPISLVTGSGMNTIAESALTDGSCNGTGIYRENAQGNYQAGEIDNKQLDMLNCIPNPASNRATFVYLLPENSSSAEIRIINMLGELIAKYQITPNSTSMEIDCSAFSNGIYFYSLINDNNLVNTKKMVITK